jgi:hypothetical protein
MTRAAALLLTATVLVPASAGAGTPRSPLALTAAPAQVALAGATRATVNVTNQGLRAVVVDVVRAGFSLDLRGRPRVVTGESARAGASWLTVAPRRFVLDPGTTRSLTVTSHLPGRVEPGDHDALVLLSTRPLRDGGVAVRMRIGVVVVVRAPGPIVRRLVVRDLRVRRAPGARLLELRLANRGNVTESVARGAVRVTLRRGALDIGLRPTGRRMIRPRTDGVVQIACPRFLQGWLTATVQIASEAGRSAARRTFRVRL